ncbi:MAG: cache domain-containing protein [Candidatus Eremiobacteraeota bacterium]|nr:cache domain-containing protein [Candidatus Eremiobacteraeota bacterium]
MSLRVRLLGTIIGAIALFFLISVIAARFVLTADLHRLGETQVSNGAGAFGGYWDSRKEQIRLLVAQDAVSETLRKSVASHDVSALADQLANAARTSGLSFLTIVDTHGRVMARANGPAQGLLNRDRVVRRALNGESVSTATLLDQSVLAGEGLAEQAGSDIKNSDGKNVAHLDKGLALVAASPISDQNERTIGAIYGGVLMNHDYDLVDQATHALGGSAALLSGDAIVASTIEQADGTRDVDQQVAAASRVIESGRAFTGTDSRGGTQYLVHIEPLKDDRNQVIGAQWYGFPISQITSIINDITRTLLIWGLIAAAIALALSIPIVQRLSNTLAARSQQIRAAAKELRVAIVGSEVSGDHVAMTRAAVERSGILIAELSSNGSKGNPKVAELRSVNEELHGDILVIDTLSQEMSNRMQQAVHRVSDLNDVAEHLNSLVTGEAAS